MKQLLYGADILYLLESGEWAVIKNGYLGIDGDTICYLGGERPAGMYDVEKSYVDHIIMPGLYNTHTHTPMTLLRGVGSDLPLDRWLQEAIYPAEKRMTEADISAGTRVALMEFLASGIVSFTDMYDMPHVTARDVLEAGLKANISRPILAFDPDEPYEKNPRVQQSLAFFKEYNGSGGGSVKVDFSIHAEYTSLPHVVRPYGEDCLRFGARMHLHLSETKKEHEECKARHGQTPAQYFHGLGVFRNPTTAAHCVHVEPGDIELLAQDGVSAIHNPTSNMKLASGFMPIQALAAHGVNIGIGTDGAASNNNLNLFEEMHLAAIIHKGYTGDPTIISPADVLKMATINGAKSQGREDSGMIAVGKKADLIAINTARPHMEPALDIPALLVYSAQAGDVAMTMVNGRVLYERGEFHSIDADRALYDIKASAARLVF